MVQYEAWEYAKLTYAVTGIWRRIGGWLERGTGSFLGDGNVLCTDLDGDYTGVYNSQRLLNCVHLRFLHVK